MVTFMCVHSPLLLGVGLYIVVSGFVTLSLSELAPYPYPPLPASLYTFQDVYVLAYPLQLLATVDFMYFAYELHYPSLTAHITFRAMHDTPHIESTKLHRHSHVYLILIVHLEHLGFPTSHCHLIVRPHLSSRLILVFSSCSHTLRVPFSVCNRLLFLSHILAWLP